MCYFRPARSLTYGGKQETAKMCFVMLLKLQPGTSFVPGKSSSGVVLRLTVKLNNEMGVWSEWRIAPWLEQGAQQTRCVDSVLA